MTADDAHRCLCFLLFIFSLLLLCASPALSSRRRFSWRTISPITTTKTSLNVSASLAQARHAASFDPSSAHRPFHDSFPSSPSIITLPLQSRDFLPSTAGNDARGLLDYEALTIARFRRDAARVRSIATRTALAVGGFSSSDTDVLLAEGKDVWNASSLEGPLIYGSILGSGEYLSRVRVGSPGRDLYLVFDTGSDVSWIQCLPCAYCYQQSGPIFDPSASSSYVSLNCNSSQCRSLYVSTCIVNSTSSSAAIDPTGSRGKCVYQVGYGDNSYTTGDLATETMTLGNSAPISGVTIGCGHDNEGLFYGAAGLLGLGGGPLSLPSQISARSFSYCLVDRDSDASSIVNISITGPPPTAPVETPLVHSLFATTYRYVGMTGISVGGKMLPFPPSTYGLNEETGTGGVIVDSGTTVTRLFPPVYNALRDAFRAGMKKLPAVGKRVIMDTCYKLLGRGVVTVPTVGFHFPGGKVLQLPAKNLLIPMDSDGTHCFAFAPSSVPLSIIGNVQQQGIRVSFDLANDRVGFTPKSC